MVFGTVFTFPGDHARTIGIKAVAKANNIDLTFSEQPRTPEHLAVSKLGKVPAFIGEDGFKLFECIAIALYITKQNEQTTLLGNTDQEYAQIIQWMSFFNQEIVGLIVEQWLPLAGLRPYDKDTVSLYETMGQAAVSVVEEHLQGKDYLVGDRLTLADIFCAGIIALGFQFFYDKAWRQKNPNVSKWYEAMMKSSPISEVTAEFKLLDEPKLKNEPPKQNGV